jgi:hypothetical protein
MGAAPYMVFAMYNGCVEEAVAVPRRLRSGFAEPVEMDGQK